VVVVVRVDKAGLCFTSRSTEAVKNSSCTSIRFLLEFLLLVSHLPAGWNTENCRVAHYIYGFEEGLKEEYCRASATLDPSLPERAKF